TKRLQDATKDASAETFNDVQRAAIAEIEKECATSDDFRCEVVTLYRGGHYDLYKYRRYQDVRLVFAPEESIAFFRRPGQLQFPALRPRRVHGAHLRKRRQAAARFRAPGMVERPARGRRRDLRLGQPGWHRAQPHRGPVRGRAR